MNSTAIPTTTFQSIMTMDMDELAKFEEFTPPKSPIDLLREQIAYDRSHPMTDEERRNFFIAGEFQKAEWLNAEQKPEYLGIHCPLCLNKGCIFYVKENRSEETGEIVTAFVTARDCSCTRQRKYLWNLKNGGFTKTIYDYSFDNFRTDEPWQMRMRTEAWNYAVSTDLNKWLWVSGQPGSGKTHICTAVCKKLMQAGRTVQYMLWSDILQRLEAVRFDEERTNLLMAEIRGVDVLYIDDFLKTFTRGHKKPQAPSDSQLRAAFNVINARYSVKKRTIISSEHLLEELTYYDTALAGRIKERADKNTIELNREEGRDQRWARRSG